MAFTVPPAKFYSDPLVSLPSWLNRTPSEGERFVPLVIDWGKQGGANMSVAFEIPNAPAPVLSQILALSVDNSLCGSDVVFYFPDSQQTYTVPAYAPGNVFPVFTGSLNFFAVALTGVSGDVTNVQIFNTLPPPIALPRAELQTISTGGHIGLGGTTTTQLIASDINGTLEAINVSLSVGITADLLADLTLSDGTNSAIWRGVAAGVASTSVGCTLIDVSQVALPFKDGVQLKIISTGTAAGGVAVNLYYRSP